MGDDVRYSAEFRASSESELSKANSLHADQGPDWIVVARLALRAAVANPIQKKSQARGRG